MPEKRRKDWAADSHFLLGPDDEAAPRIWVPQKGAYIRELTRRLWDVSADIGSRQIFDALDRKVVKMEPDGNCLFRAIADQLCILAFVIMSSLLATIVILVSPSCLASRGYLHSRLAGSVGL